MRFQLFHKRYFNALEGSYSIVTQREEYDSQITLTDFEADMVIEYFGVSNINIGKVGNNRLKSSKEFLLYPNLTPIYLNLVFPKPSKSELRLYISSKAGFKPKKGDIWFLFLDRDKKLVIGTLNLSTWGDLDQIDPEDQDFQQSVEGILSQRSKIIKMPTPKIITTITTKDTIKYVRNPIIAAASLEKANFKCEINPYHKTFIAQKTNVQFVEAHHFVPMKFQANFDFPLDNSDNIISLCPNCHRGIHLAIGDYKTKLITRIYRTRGAINKFTIKDLLSFYNCIIPNN